MYFNLVKKHDVDLKHVRWHSLKKLVHDTVRHKTEDTIDGRLNSMVKRDVVLQP